MNLRVMLAATLLAMPVPIAMAQSWYDTFDFEAAGVVAYWPLDSDAVDRSGNGHDGTLFGDVAFETDGCREAARFDGVGDYIATAGQVGYGNELTMCGWLQVDGPATNDYSYIFIKTSNVNNAYQSLGYVHDGVNNVLHVDVSDYSNPWYLNYFGSLGEGTMHHVCATATPGDVRLYLDGVLVAQGALSGPLDHGSFTGNFIGGFPVILFGPYSHNGLIDDVVVFDRALSENEVAALGSDANDDCIADFWVPPPQCSYGPEAQPLVFVRTTGKPVTQVAHWQSCGGEGVVVIAGASPSAVVRLNGAELLGPSDLPLPGGMVQLPVSLLAGDNVLSVELRGKPGTGLSFLFND